jgi:hypothetical protein
MRRHVGTAALLVTLITALPVGAQTAASSFFTGANPREIKNTPIDVSKVTKAYNMNNVFRTPTPQKPISFSNLMPHFSMPSWPPKVAVPTVLQGPNPFQPNRPVGVNLFDTKK